MDLTLTTLVHQKGSTPIEAVVGFIDRMDEAEQELECKRRDGTAFTSARRGLHLKDEESVVRLSLWGKKAAVQEPRRERLCVGDLLVVTNVQVDRFMGDKSFKASGFRPAIRVIRELATARSVLDRLNLDEPGPYVKRVEELWRWKELEDIRDQRMRRQARQRDADLLHRATSAAAAATVTVPSTQGGGIGGDGGGGSGFDALCLGQEDCHVRGVALPLTWVEVVPKGYAAAGAGGGGGKKPGGRLPPPNPRFLRTKVTDGKGVSHVLDLPQGMEGLLAFEHAARTAATATAKRGGGRSARGTAAAAAGAAATGLYHPLPVFLQCLGARAVGGLLVPCPTPRTRITLLPSPPSPSSPPPPPPAPSDGKETPSLPLSVTEAVRRLKQPASRSALSSSLSAAAAAAAAAARGGEGETVLHIVGRIVEVAVGSEKAPLLSHGEEGDSSTEAAVQQLVVAAAPSPANDGGWRYKDVYLRVVDTAAAVAAVDGRAAAPTKAMRAQREEKQQQKGEGKGAEGEGELWIRVPDAALRPLVAHVPAARLVQEQQEAATATAAAAAGGSENNPAPSFSSFTVFFYARWVPRALQALASPRNPPFSLTVSRCGHGEDPPAAARGLGLLASQMGDMPVGGSGGMCGVELLCLAEASLEGAVDDGELARMAEGCG